MEKQTMETPFGTMELTATNGKHIHVGSSGDSMVNGVAYGISVHFYLWKDGCWHVGMESDGGEYTRVINALYMNKRNSSNYSDRGPTDAARKKVLTILPALLSGWALLNPTVLMEAEVNDYTKQVEKVEAEITDLTTKLQLAQTLRGELIAILNDKKQKLDTAANG